MDEVDVSLAGDREPFFVDFREPLFGEILVTEPGRRGDDELEAFLPEFGPAALPFDPEAGEAENEAQVPGVAF